MHLHLRALEPEPGEPDDGGAPMTREDYLAVLKAVAREMKDDDIVSLASGVAFRIFLALIPSMIAAVAIFGLVADASHLRGLVESSSAILPGAAAEFFTDQLKRAVESASGGIVSVSMAVGIFAATSAAVALVRALNRAYDVTERRPFLAQRGIALVLTVALFGALLGLVALLVAGPVLERVLFPEALYRNGLDALLTVARVAAAIVLVMLLFAFVFWIGPNRERPRWQWFTPGAVVGVVGWLALSSGFALYTRITASDYAESGTYGTLGGIVVLLLWLWLSHVVLLAGAELNSELEKARARHVATVDGSGFAVPELSGEPVSVDAEPSAAPAAERLVPTETRAEPPPRAGGGSPRLR